MATNLYQIYGLNDIQADQYVVFSILNPRVSYLDIFKVSSDATLFIKFCSRIDYLSDELDKWLDSHRAKMAVWP